MTNIQKMNEEIFNSFFGEDLKKAEEILKKDKEDKKEEEKMNNNKNGGGFVVNDPEIAKIFTSQKAREQMFNSFFGDDLKKAEEILKEDED